MRYNDLIKSNLNINLVEEIKNIDLSVCSNNDLLTLKNWLELKKSEADALTMEDEFVGYTYSNLSALRPKINLEQHKRGLPLVKTMIR